MLKGREIIGIRDFMPSAHCFVVTCKHFRRLVPNGANRSETKVDQYGKDESKLQEGGFGVREAIGRYPAGDRQHDRGPFQEQFEVEFIQREIDVDLLPSVAFGH